MRTLLTSPLFPLAITALTWALALLTDNRLPNYWADMAPFVGLIKLAMAAIITIAAWSAWGVLA